MCQVDEAFAAEMAKVCETYPDNHDVAVVYASVRANTLAVQSDLKARQN